MRSFICLTASNESNSSGIFYKAINSYTSIEQGSLLKNSLDKFKYLQVQEIQFYWNYFFFNSNTQ